MKSLHSMVCYGRQLLANLVRIAASNRMVKNALLPPDEASFLETKHGKRFDTENNAL